MKKFLLSIKLLIPIMAFAQTTGYVLKNQDGTTDIPAGSVTSTQLAGSIATSKILGITTIGTNMLTLTNPSAITFPRFNADNTVTSRSAANLRTDLGSTTVGDNLFQLANPGAITFIKIAADNSVSTRSAANFRADLGSTTLGDNLFTLTNPGAITFPKFNADNTITAESAATHRTSIGLGSVENTAISTYAGTTSTVTVGTIGTGTWQGGVISSTYGGTGVNNGGRTLTIGTNNVTINSSNQANTITLTNNFSTAGNFALTLTQTQTSNVTLPGSGTIDGGWTYLRVITSDATTTGQSLVDITGLVSGTLTNSTKYEVEFFLDCTTSSVTTGTEYGIGAGGSGGAAVVNVLFSGTTTSAAAAMQTINAAATATTAMLTTSGSSGVMYGHGFVTTRGAGTATISITHLKVTSGTSTVKFNSSWMRYRLATAF